MERRRGDRDSGIGKTTKSNMDSRKKNVNRVKQEEGKGGREGEVGMGGG